jgi:hypothetical protein
LPLPDEWIAELAEHAQVVYHHNPHFRRLLRRAANAGSDWLESFTRHWLCAILASRRPDLLSRLPPSYAIGRGPCSGLRPRKRRRNLRQSFGATGDVPAQGWVS